MSLVILIFKHQKLLHSLHELDAAGERRVQSEVEKSEKARLTSELEGIFIWMKSVGDKNLKQFG